MVTIRDFHRELAAMLNAHPDAATVIPGGAYDAPVDVGRRDDYPAIYRYPPGAMVAVPRSVYMANVVVIPGGRFVNATARHGDVFDVYTRIEARAARGPAGRDAIDAVWEWIDGLDGAVVTVRGFARELDTLSAVHHSTMDDDAETLAQWSWQDCRITVAQGE